MNKEELMSIPVSFYRNMKSTVAEAVTVGIVLKAIQGNFYESQIIKIRKLKEQGRQDEANELKSNLHAVTFSATFKDRRLSSLYQTYNNLMVIDIDKLKDEEMERVRLCLEDNPIVACYWMSPSGSGWKGLVPLNYLHKDNKMDVVDIHHRAFKELEEFFNNEYQIQLDTSGKDITRLCFMSWYPNLRIKDVFSSFNVELDNLVVDQRNNTKPIKRVVMQSSGKPIEWNIVDGQKQEDRKGNSYDRRLLERIYKYLASRDESITSTYEDWVKVAFAIAHTFHSVYGRKMFLKFCELDGASHNEAKSERLIYDAYISAEKKCDFSTIIYLARGKGFIR